MSVAGLRCRSHRLIPYSMEVAYGEKMCIRDRLKTIYKDAADTIVGNCDSTLFLGGKEKSTLKEISELLGKELCLKFQTTFTFPSSFSPKP